MKSIIEDFIDGINEILEDCKEKEYIVFCDSHFISNGVYDCYYFTKNQLLKFMKKHETYRMKIFRIKDEIKIHKEFTIEEKEDD